MPKTKPQSWRTVKAKIILRYGTISAAAADLGCSTEAIRISVQGKCPRIQRRLEEALK